MSESRVDNPVLADEEPYRPEHDTGAQDRPADLESHLAQVESQDLTPEPGTEEKQERPYAMPGEGEDEGGLGEGGQLRYGDAGGGGSS